MVAINTRRTCKLMRCPSFQHNKKISEFHSNSKQSLVLNSFINENVERIRISSKAFKSYCQRYNIQCILFEFLTVNSHLNQHQRKYFEKDLLAHISRTCVHAPGDESWLTWIISSNYLTISWWNNTDGDILLKLLSFNRY